MNKNMFAGPHFRPASRDVVRRIGSTLGVLHEEALEDLGLDDLIKDFDNLIAEVPVGVVKESYQKRRDECMDKSVASRYMCLYNLFQDVKREIKDGGGSDTPPLVLPPKEDEPPSNWGWVPWVAGGVLAVGATYAIIQSTKGTPKKGK